MRRKIDVRVRVDGETRNPLADIPDICPTCGRPVVNPTYLGALTTIYGGKLQAAFACSGDDCNSVIVGVYDELIAGYGYKLSSILPQVVRDPENIPASVRTVSPQFAEIYKQA